MDPLRTIDLEDLKVLLESEPKELLGRIVKLNRTARYHNSLDALLLAGIVIEMKAASQADGGGAQEQEYRDVLFHPVVLPIHPD